MRLRNVLPIAAIIIAVVIILSLKGCNNGESGPPGDTTATHENATHETANHTGEDPTNYESSEAGNSPVSESTHESTEAGTEATEPNSTEAKPSEPKPTEPKPTEPKPTEPKPTEPKPTEPKPTEPKPTEPKPTEPKPTEPKPTEPKPTEPKPTEPKPTEPKPTEPKPTEPTPTNPPHTHSWSGWTQTKAPTCTEPGTETRTCSCGATDSRAVNALGHTWQETAPTCTEAGSKTCKVCGKSESGSAALGHDWVHHDEEGHWREILTCRCGAVFYSYEEWVTHSESGPREEWDNHAGFENHAEWVVDKPAYESCSRCGATR